MDTYRFDFVPYGGPDAACAVVALTSPEQAFMHTYYDVCPQSPDGRQVLCLNLPYEDHEPAEQDVAELCVLDLASRQMRVVARTAGWGFQTAAHQLWGDDGAVFFNDKSDGVAAGRRLELGAGQTRNLDGPVWQVDTRQGIAIGTCLVRANLTQGGYGVSVAPARQTRNTVRAADDDGLFLTDPASGKTRLLVSLAEAWAVLPDKQDLDQAVLYAFHCKLSPPGERILLVVRARFPDGSFVANLLTCDRDGADLRCVVPARLWRRGGHHPIWHPDGRRVLMNLSPGNQMRFCLIDGRSGQVEVLLDDPPGTGHPSISPDGRWLLTDDTREAGGVRTAAIRLVDLRTGKWRDLCALTSPAAGPSPLRRDAHPVWDRSGTRVFFLAAPRGRRQIFLADPALGPGEQICF